MRIAAVRRAARNRTAETCSAALIATVAWLGIAIQFQASLHKIGSVALAIWAMLRFFTILSNLLVAILFTGIAIDRGGNHRPFLIGGAALLMILVGLVYAVLLRGLIELSGGVRLADILLHMVTPIIVPLFWLGFVPKGRLRWRDPWLWAAVPLLYLFYALARGAAAGIYPYPFIDVARIGWARTMANAAAIAAAFLGAGFLFVALDRLLARQD